MNTLEKTYPMSLHHVIENNSLHFIVIGVGGTGGYLVPNLARQISIMNRGNRNHQLTLADADDVEDANLVRQNFIRPDIGKNKAAVMAQRYSAAFGLPITIADSYVEEKKTLEELSAFHKKTIPVIVGAVDNNKTRQLVYEFFINYKEDLFWLDSGNEEYNGQVIMGFNLAGSSEINDFNHWDSRIFYLPSVVDVYPDIMEDKETKFITEMSCAERAVHHPQSIATNITAANILFNMSNQLLNASVMNLEGIKSSMVTFNTKTNGFKHHLHTEEYLKSRYKG